MEKNENSLHDVLNSGELYDPNAGNLAPVQNACLERLHEFNRTPSTPEGLKKRFEMLKDMLGSCGGDDYIETPVYSNWGLSHVHLGKGVYMNFHATLVDDADIYVGDHTMFGPNVTICTAAHPVSPSLRLGQIEYNKPVRIGKNCWIGAGAIILPGITVGDHSIVGAGSVVTHDVPPMTIVAGNPARILRRITEEDEKSYDHGKPIGDEWKTSGRFPIDPD